MSGSEDMSMRIWKLVTVDSANGKTHTPKFLASLNGHTAAISQVSPFILTSHFHLSLVWGRDDDV